MPAEYELGLSLYDASQFSRCSEVLKDALQRFNELRLEKPELLASIWLTLGNASLAEVMHGSRLKLITKDRKADALNAYDVCARTLKGAFGKHYPGLVAVFVNSGNILFSLGDIDNALRFFQRARAIAESAPLFLPPPPLSFRLRSDVKVSLVTTSFKPAPFYKALPLGAHLFFFSDPSLAATTQRATWPKLFFSTRKRSPCAHEAKRAKS